MHVMSGKSRLFGAMVMGLLSAGVAAQGRTLVANDYAQAERFMSYNVAPLVDHAVQKVDWRRGVVRATTPKGSRVTVLVRAGSSHRPDRTWSAWQRADRPLGIAGRYLQYRVVLSASTSAVPSVSAVGFTHTGTAHSEGEHPGTRDVADALRAVLSALPGG